MKLTNPQLIIAFMQEGDNITETYERVKSHNNKIKYQQVQQVLHELHDYKIITLLPGKINTRLVKFNKRGAALNNAFMTAYIALPR